MVPAGAMKDAIVVSKTRGIPLKRRKASRAVVWTGRFPLGIQRPTYTREEDCLRSKDNARMVPWAKIYTLGSFEFGGGVGRW